MLPGTGRGTLIQSSPTNRHLSVTESFSRLTQRVSIIPSTVENKRYTMAELYELRRVIIKHSRSIPPGPARNEHRQIATSMRSLSRDRDWLAVHTVEIEAAIATVYGDLC